MAKDNFKRIDKGISLKPHDTEPAIIPNHDGRIYYDAVLKKARIQINDTWKGLGGGGGLGVNFIPEDASNAESGSTGYNTYENAANQVPVDGTGGSPAGISFTVTNTPSEVLYELASFKLSKDAADRQGMGVSLDFTIPQGYRNRTHFINFIYKTTTNFSFGDGTFANPSDISVFIYDVDQSQLVPLSNYYLDGSGTFLSGFTPNDLSSENYRIIFHISTTNALAWDLLLDMIVVGPNSYVTGSFSSDEVIQTGIVINATTSLPTKGGTTVDRISYSRNGEYLIARYEYNQTSGGAGGFGDYRFTLPTGLRMNSSKVTFYTANVGSSTQRPTSIIGPAVASGSAAIVGSAVPYDETTFRIIGAIGPFGSGNTAMASAGSGSNADLGNSNVSISATIIVPIEGWDSGMVLSSESTNKLVVLHTTAISNGALGTGFQDVIFNSKNNSSRFEQDTNNIYDINTGLVTVKETASYIISANVTFSPIGDAKLYIRDAAGNILKFLSSSPAADTRQNHSGTAILFLKAGDQFKITLDRSIYNSNYTGDATGSTTYLSVYKLANPQTIAFDGNRTATISYVSSTGGGSSSGGGVFNTLALNTHTGDNSFATLLTNQFVLQPGKYHIRVQAPAYAVRTHVAKLVDVTASPVDIKIGSAGYQEFIDGGSSHSFIVHDFTISTPRVFEIQHATQDARATVGFGTSGFGLDVTHVQIDITKLA